MDISEALKKAEKFAKNGKADKRPPTPIDNTYRPYDEDVARHLERETQQEKTEANGMTQTYSKPIANLEQSYSNPMAKPIANLEQSYSNPMAKPIADPIANLEQSYSNPIANLGQTYSNTAKKWTFSRLFGRERDFVIFVYQECIKNRSTTTTCLTAAYILNHINSTYLTMKSTTNRLLKKNCLIRHAFKDGKGGWTQYGLPDHIYKEIMQAGRETGQADPIANLEQTYSKPIANLTQTYSKHGAKPMAQPIAAPPSSSSNIINIKTTTTSDGATLPGEWLALDLSEATETFGFTQTHLRQLYKARGETYGTERSESEILKLVIDSLDHFVYDLQYNGRRKDIKKTPIEFFLGIMHRKGAYTAPENYETPKQIAMREYTEREEMKAAKEREIEERLYRLKFDTWKIQLTEDEKKQIISNGAKQIPDHVKLDQHFRNNLWPAKKSEVLNER